MDRNQLWDAETPSLIIQRTPLFAVPAAMLRTKRRTLEGARINICAREEGSHLGLWSWFLTPFAGMKCLWFIFKLACKTFTLSHGWCFFPALSSFKLNEPRKDVPQMLRIFNDFMLHSEIAPATFCDELICAVTESAVGWSELEEGGGGGGGEEGGRCPET